MNTQQLQFSQSSNNQEDIINLKTVTLSKSYIQKNLDLERFNKALHYLQQNAQQSGNQRFEIFPFCFYPAIRKSNQKAINFLQLNNRKASQNFESTVFLLLPNSICHISFQNLELLNLSKQQISNIQSLSFLIAPKLRSLEIYDNKLRNLEPLKKSDFKNLEVITFYQNCIKEHEQVYRGNFKKLAKYEFDSNQYDPNLLQDYRFLCKMEQPMIKKLYVHSTVRIKIQQRSFIKKLLSPDAIFVFNELTRKIYTRSLTRD